MLKYIIPTALLLGLLIVFFSTNSISMSEKESKESLKGICKNGYWFEEWKMFGRTEKSFTCYHEIGFATGTAYAKRIEFSPSTTPKRGISLDTGSNGAFMSLLYNHDYTKVDFTFFFNKTPTPTPTIKIVTDQGEEVLTWEEFKERLAPKEKVSFFPTNPVRPGSGREYIFLDDDGSAFVGEYKITFSRIRKH